MKTIRSFLAIKLDLATVENLAATQKRLRGACRDAGINFFDTADMYSKGASEGVTGTA